MSRKCYKNRRALNSFYPTDVKGNRKIKPDFDAVIMKHMGHYPMLERPAEFNDRVKEIVASLTR
jgi:pimeloyl-ACP methyl ester carboxylesterase